MKTNCLKSKRQFIKQDYAIKEARALTRTTRELYQTLLWFQRGKTNCFPGYEKIMKRSDIRSKVTISLHLKVLIKVGLVKRERRGKMQSNIYFVVKADDLTDRILKNLKREHGAIIREINEQMGEERKIRQAKQELKSRKLVHPRREKTLSNSTYPQKSEVQQMYPNISSNEDINIYSSNLKKDSNLKNEIRTGGENEEKRGGGFKSFSEILNLRKQTVNLVKNIPPESPLRPLEASKAPCVNGQ